MKTEVNTLNGEEGLILVCNENAEPFADLKRSVYSVLETYSNIHRGSGQKSLVTTYLFEEARVIVLNFLALDKDKYTVIFCTQRRAAKLKSLLTPGSYHLISSKDIGLPLGIWALAVNRKELPKSNPFQTGGGTTRLVASDWIVWADAPGKFEAGTPAIINVITFAKALSLIRQSGRDYFRSETTEKRTAGEILYQDNLEQFSGRDLLNELRKTLIGGEVIVPTAEGSKRYINLDNGASTPTFEPVWDSVWKTWLQPEQVHQEIIHEVRSICERFLGASPETYDLVFASNTTEAINLIAESFGNEQEHEFEPVIINTILEHNSNDLPWRLLSGFSLIRLDVDSEGFLDLKGLELLLDEYNERGLHGKKRIRLLALSGASNVLGVFNDLASISRIVHKYGVRILVDAAQLVAHRKIELESLGIDYLVFSAHKAYAPFGSGVLVVRKGLLNFNPSELELIQSSGEENPGGIAALGKSLVLLDRIGFDLIKEEELALTKRLLQGLSQIEGMNIFGVRDTDSPRFANRGGVIAFEIKGFFANVIAKKLAEQGGIGVRYGCHCAHLLVKHLLRLPPFLERFQKLIVTLLPKVSLPGIVRISLGIGNGKEDVDLLIHELKKISSQRNKGKNKLREPIGNVTHVFSQKDVQKQIDDFSKAVAIRVFG